jgi:hypothetical protein
MNYNRLLLFCATLFLNSVFAIANVNDDYFYRPYPILLVHGFNSDSKETWNVSSYKKNSDDYSISYSARNKFYFCLFLPIVTNCKYI